VTSRYDLVGNTTQTGDGTGAVTTYTYDTHNKMTTLTDAAGTTSFQYDLADNVVRRVDGRGGVTTYAYNGMSRVGSMTVDGKTTAYSYDELGNVVRTTDPARRLTTLTLDAQPPLALIRDAGRDGDRRRPDLRRPRPAHVDDR
jgi:YD repeat-containing protein